MVIPPFFTPVPRLFPWFVALCSLLLVSCSPYPENPPYQPRHRAIPKPLPAAPSAPAHVPAPAVIPAPPEKRTKPVATHPLPPTITQPAHAQPSQPAPQSRPANPPAVEKPTAPPKSDLPVAAAAPGKAGYVLSPYNHKLILVRGIPSGTVVPDPAYPDSDKKYFRVP